MVGKTDYIGYVLPRMNGSRIARNAEQKEIVVSFGGGWECEELAVPIIQAFGRLVEGGADHLRLYLTTGPAASSDAWERISRAAEPWQRSIELHQFDSHFSERLAACDLAILQGGSTVFQVLESDIPVLLYARDWKTLEQEERTSRISRYDNIELLHRPDIEDFDALAKRLGEMLERPRQSRQTGIRVTGLTSAADTVLTTLDRRIPVRSS